jgi:glycolate oxidase FAD binding subunit
VTTLVPRNAGDVTDVLRWAAAEGEALEVLAGGTRRGFGRPVDALHVLDVSALNGVVSHEPEELILTALPATPLAEIEALLASRNQCLAFEPPYLTAGASTFGGAVATAFSGPRRPKSGSVRDHVLGITAVSGRGELFTGGGKVVKNVTGYDLPKLLTGSYGTLAVYTEITVKVLPAPADTRTLLISGLAADAAVRAMTAVLQSTADASGACHLPSGIDVPGKPLNDSVTAIRLEGVTPSVEFRLARLRDQVTAQGSLAVLDRDTSIAFWKAVRDVAPFADDASRMLWRISVPPAQGAETLAGIERSLPGAKAFIDWGGGLLWLQHEAVAESAAAAAIARKIRAALPEHQGHATLVRASAEMRRAVDVFHPQAPALAALSNRVKSQFDPKQVLNPGRMVAGV